MCLTMLTYSYMILIELYSSHNKLRISVVHYALLMSIIGLFMGINIQWALAHLFRVLKMKYNGPCILRPPIKPENMVVN